MWVMVSTSFLHVGHITLPNPMLAAFALVQDPYIFALIGISREDISRPYPGEFTFSSIEGSTPSREGVSPF